VAKRKQPFTYHVPPGQPRAELPSRRRERASATPWLYEDPEPDDEVAPAWPQSLQRQAEPQPAPEPAAPPPPWLQSTPAPHPRVGAPADAPPEPSWLYHQQPTPAPLPQAPPSWGAFAGTPAGGGAGPTSYGPPPGFTAPGYPPPPFAPGALPAPAGRPAGAGRGGNGALFAVIGVATVVAAAVGFVVLHKSTPQAASHLGPPNLKAELLVVNDLPPGWTVDNSNNSGGGGNDPACFQKAGDAMNTLTQAEADFANDPASLTEDLAWFPGTGATLAFDAFAKDLSSCGQVTLSDGRFSATGTVTQMSIAPLGDQSSAWQLPMTATEDGQQVPITMDVVLVRQQQTVVSLMAFSLGNPDPPTLQTIARKAINKVP
jgi:hypothetical protein